MTMTTFFVGIHGEPGVKRVKVKNEKIMSFCYSVTFVCNFTMTEPLWNDHMYPQEYWHAWPLYNRGSVGSDLLSILSPGTLIWESQV